MGCFQTIFLISAFLVVNIEAKGGWTQWTTWSVCTKACGCGSQYRTRICNSFPKVLGGTGCNGTSYSIRKCNDIPCAMWGEWSSFGPCTCSCGGGTQAQSRVCNRIPKALGGPGCTGNNTRFRVCNAHICGACPRAPPLGNNLLDSSFSASTTYSGSNYLPKTGRLNSQYGWCPARTNVPNQYLQIDLKAVYVVCAVATQGHVMHGKHWTTKYNLAISIDGRTWHVYKVNSTVKVFPGNSDKSSVVKHVLPMPIKARYIRFIPTAHAGWPCLRVEVYGHKQ